MASRLIQLGVTHLLCVALAGEGRAVADTVTVTGTETLTIVDEMRRYEQSVGCWEPGEGGWHLSISWLKGVPCKPGSKARWHARAEIEDLECSAERCVLPRPGATFRTTLAIDVGLAPDNRTRYVQASVNVLRHDPPFLFLAIETTDREQGITATGIIRVKLYKKAADKVDPDSWRPSP